MKSLFEPSQDEMDALKEYTEGYDPLENVSADEIVEAEQDYNFKSNSGLCDLE